MLRPAVRNIFIDEEQNPDQYFEAVLREIIVQNLLEPQDIANIQGELQALITEQTVKYTSGESSSIRVETAQQLLRSIYYCLGFRIKEVKGTEDKLELLKNTKLKTLFLEGTESIKKCLQYAKELFLEVKTKRLIVHNYAYDDTIINGLDVFFVNYNYRFAAHETPCDIDYPLSKDIMDFTGVEYMYKYLFYLRTENKFCRYFSNREIEKILRGYSKYYKEDLLNIYEIVLCNVLACVMCGNDWTKLSITEEERRLLEKRLAKDNQKELQERLVKAFADVCSNMDFNDLELKYLREILPSLATRIERNLKFHCLNTIFISGLEHDEEKNESYQSGRQMEDEELRTIISEVKDCRYISDKLEIIKNHIKSLADLIELLEECFWDEEYKEVFQLLNEFESKMLWDLIKEEEDSNLYEIDKGNWKAAFIEYYKAKE